MCIFLPVFYINILSFLHILEKNMQKIRQSMLFLNEIYVHIMIMSIVILYKMLEKMEGNTQQILVRCNNFVIDLLTKGGEKYIIGGVNDKAVEVK